MNGRKRIIYVLWIILTMALGLGSRVFAEYLPTFVVLYVGDILWALMVFWMIGFLWNKQSTKQVAGVTFLFAYGIELSQLYNAPWINTIRETVLGGLILGHGFLWSDLISYAIGIGIGCVIEYVDSKMS